MDDDPGVREVCAAIFGDFEVEMVGDGCEVTPVLARFRPQVVITDLSMPHEGGLSVVQRVKAEDPTIEVLVITGYGRIEDAVAAMKYGASDFILKPFDMEQIQLAVARCLERQRLVRSHASLQDAHRELKQLTELKEKFLRLTSHELRGPLTVLQGYEDLLPMLVDSPAELLAAADAMALAIHNLVEIVNNITLLQDLKQKRIPLSPRPCDLPALFEQILTELHYFTGHRAHTLRFSHQGTTGGMISGDALRIVQIARELLLNAIKFTPDGGTITLTLTFPAEQPGWFAFMVEDTGIGIPPEKLVRIFESFYEAQETQNHSTSRTEFKGGGVGIGLTLVNELVHAYGGRLGISSTLEVGTSVTVTLPELTLPVGDRGGR
ncbi:MAG: hybrid sensor histidine kinase/response regulator [Blastocatellia bacterium]|nr:hybrid sensor histidine kinase/response regulator [Blastocatellia bacterium]